MLTAGLTPNGALDVIYEIVYMRTYSICLLTKKERINTDLYQLGVIRFVSDVIVIIVVFFSDGQLNKN